MRGSQEVPDSCLQRARGVLALISFELMSRTLPDRTWTRLTTVDDSPANSVSAIFVLRLHVVGTTIRGKPVSEEQIQAWADEAEMGFPVEQLRKRGRRPVGAGPGEMIAVRMDEALLAR